MISITTEIQNAFSKKHHLKSISFDLGKVYATTRRYNIVATLKKLKVNARMLSFTK